MGSDGIRGGGRPAGARGRRGSALRADPTRALARAASASGGPGVPLAVRERCVDLVLDTIAVIASASSDAGWHSLATLLRGPAGGATLIGDDRPVAASTAALLNGAATPIEQLSDGHRRARGHPAAHVVPAAFAIAEEQDADPEAFLAAVLAGYEVAARVGIALGGTRRGVHDIGTWGVVGTAVAVAHLLTNGDEAALWRAIEGSAGVTLRPPRSALTAGAPVHFLAAGLGVQAGLVSGTAAAAGFAPVTGTLERFLGRGMGAQFRPAALVAGLSDGRWSTFEALAGYVKFHPTSAHLHGVNDAVEDLLRLEHVPSREIERVEVITYRAAAQHATARPANAFAARFSIPWTVAAAITTGGLGPDAFSRRLLVDPATLSLARRVRVTSDPDHDAGYPEGRPSTVQLHLRDGRVLAAHSTIPRGDAGNPVPRSAIHAKAQRLLASRFGERWATEVVEAVLAMGDGQSRPVKVGALLRGAAR